MLKKCIIFTLHKILLRDQIKEDEIHGDCSEYGIYRKSRGSVVVEELCYKAEGRGIASR
jgi:hypothetical protein